MFEEKKIDLEIGGKEIEISTGKLARQASAVTVKCNNTVLLVTVTSSDEPRDGIDFFPLLVEFEEKLYSVGRIPGSYNRREGRASDKAILTCRLIDRPVRPLFPKGFRNDVQINIVTLSTDQTAQPDTLGMLGAGFALELSGLPFEGPLGSIRVGRNSSGEFIANPSEEECLEGDLDIVVSGTKDSIMMVEAGAKFVAEDTMISAIEFAHEEIKKQCEKIAELGKMCGASRQEFESPENNKELEDLVKKHAHDDLVISMTDATKQHRKDYVAAAKTKVEEALIGLLESRDEEDALVAYLADHSSAVSDEIRNYEKELLRKKITETKVRADGRSPDQVRPIDVQVGLLPNVHGDGLFTRGNTQALSILSLGTERDARSLDGLDSEEEKFYMHNYNFPAFSVGEVRPNRGPGRREIGHGALAERAIIPSLPEREDFPYAIRVVSEVLESSGSTSMAATCGSSLALMNGGVPVKSPIAGVAMGLIKEGDGFTVLTDIHELEDFLGDMDFKVAGNAEGITALQMDIKIKGISVEILRTALSNAKAGRLHILNKMIETIPEPSAELKGNAPRIVSTQIPSDKIGAVIGSGGKNIKWIIETTGADVNIDDSGSVKIYTNDVEAGERAKYIVETMANGAQVGEVYEGEVVKILDKVGAIVELLPGLSGLVHISQIAHERVNDVEKYFTIGDKVQVKVLEVDNFKGRISLSTKALQEKPEGAESKEAPAEEPVA